MIQKKTHGAKKTKHHCYIKGGISADLEERNGKVGTKSKGQNKKDAVATAVS